MELLAARYTLDQVVELQLWVHPQLREVPYHLLREFIGRKYNKVKERMENGTMDEDDSAENVEVPNTCAICSGECRRTEERAYYNCGHTYHLDCTLPRTMDNCLVCGQELFSYLLVLEGESIFW